MSKLSRFFKMNRYERQISICRNTYSFFFKSRFKKIGDHSYIFRPIYLSGTQNIQMGSYVGIWHNARIECIDFWNDQRLTPSLIIGDHVDIGQDLHLTVGESVIIEDGVVCSARVTITDISHVTEDEAKPVLDQGLRTAPVVIGKEAFVGIGATILPGVRIGKRAIVGAGAVVTKDVPDGTTVVGIPAKEIK